MATPKYMEIIKLIERRASEICLSMYEDVESDEERHCLLGWLALDAGIALPPPRYNGHVIGMAGTKRFARELERRYGLSLRRLRQLQFANDDASDSAELIEVVTRLLEEWSGQRRIAA